jgi:hypothetical protein
LNPYKEAWLSNSMMEYAASRPLQRQVVQSKKRQKRITPQQATQVVARQKAEASLMKGAHSLAKHAAQSQIKGKVGIGLRVTGRIGTRLIPIVGTAMLAYDLYRAYEYLTE